jgi:hypothetical protein
VAGVARFWAAKLNRVPCQGLQLCLSLRYKQPLQESAEEAPCLMGLFHFGWRDSLSINKAEFCYIPLKTPLSFIDSSNTGWAGPVSDLCWEPLSAYATDGKPATCSKGHDVQ